MFNIVTIGSCTEDITLYTEDGVVLDNKKDILRKQLLSFEYGSKIEIKKFFFGFGGGASNAAACFSKLGFNTAILTSIGDDERGRRMLRNFHNFKINTSKIKIIKGESSAFSVILLDKSRERITFTIRGAAGKLVIDNNDQKILKNSEWTYMSSISGNWKDILDNVFLCSEQVAWNPGRRQLEAGVKFLGKYLKKTKIIFLNQDEATEIVLSSPRYRTKSRAFLNNIRNLLRAVKSFGSEIIVITRGKKGADAYDGREFFHQDIIKEQSRIDATGVGDAFNSSFLAGYIFYKKDIKKSLYLGALNSSSVISQQGAQRGLLSKKNIKIK